MNIWLITSQGVNLPTSTSEYNQKRNNQWGRTPLTFKASLIDSDTYALLCYRYIELNPVRANMVQHPSEYPWSSYRTNALGHYDALITPHCMYHAFGQDDITRQTQYRSLFAAQIDEMSLAQMREATNKAWVLGSEHFKQKIATQLNRRIDKLAKGGDRKSDEYQKQKINRV